MCSAPLSRRAALSALAAVAFSQLARAQEAGEPDGLQLHDLQLEGSASLARRASLLVPADARPEKPLPVLILLHGLGETGDERAGAYAWIERYGLRSSYGRLAHPPVQVAGRHLFLSDERASQIDRELAQQALRGMILVCPYTPNVHRAADPQGALERYGQWLADVLLPEVQKRAPANLKRVGIDGCSLGGFIAFEVFLRRRELFVTCGGVQSAIGKARVPGYVTRFSQALADLPFRRLHIETSTGDPFHDANVALARQLMQRGSPVTLSVPPGPHTQPWLREVGTLEMLLWHERQLWGASIDKP